VFGFGRKAADTASDAAGSVAGAASDAASAVDQTGCAVSSNVSNALGKAGRTLLTGVDALGDGATVCGRGIGGVYNRAGHALGDVRRTTVGVTTGLAGYVLTHFWPWDHDRHYFAPTFWNQWSYHRAEGGTKASAGLHKLPLKITSTYKPLTQEWKLTTRVNTLPRLQLCQGIGKAGMYLKGEGAPYVGVELDKVVSVPKLKGTGVFANANWRSTRSEEKVDDVVASAGVQQTYKVGGLATADHPRRLHVAQRVDRDADRSRGATTFRRALRRRHRPPLLVTCDSFSGHVARV